MMRRFLLRDGQDEKDKYLIRVISANLRLKILNIFAFPSLCGENLLPRRRENFQRQRFAVAQTNDFRIPRPLSVRLKQNITEQRPSLRARSFCALQARRKQDTKHASEDFSRSSQPAPSAPQC